MANPNPKPNPNPNPDPDPNPHPHPNPNPNPIPNANQVFVPELRSHGRKRGPLVSLFAWWRCAVRAWPRAHFVGKADDDVYVHLAGLGLGVLVRVRCTG